MEQTECLSKALAAFEAINRRDFDAFVDLVHEDASFEFPGTSLLAGAHQGEKGIRRFLKRMTIAVPDLQFTVVNTLATGSLVALEWTNRGTTLKGAPYENRGVTIIEFSGDKIKRLRDYLDTERLKG
ncbi:MAG: nuclear transport factor 2 family protein [Chloroflexi bacterium]|nr:nuclear transport factor 2 family protein [Chloroflexota bacterium]